MRRFRFRRGRKNYFESLKQNIFWMVFSILILSLILSYLNLAVWQNVVFNVGLWLLVSVLLTGLIQIGLQKLTGNLLEVRLFKLKIWKFSFPITLFLIVTLILKFTLFKGF
jgi:hypothetical protein